MNFSTHILRRTAALSAVAAGLIGAVTVAPAVGATTRPPCTRQALTAGLKRGTQKHPHGKIAKGKGSFGCAGPYAYAAVDLKLFTITQVYKAQGGRWATINRTKPCNKKRIPKRIYTAACLTS
jgi:hypothetical protein